MVICVVIYVVICVSMCVRIHACVCVGMCVDMCANVCADTCVAMLTWMVICVPRCPFNLQVICVAQLHFGYAPLQISGTKYPYIAWNGSISTGQVGVLSRHIAKRLASADFKKRVFLVSADCGRCFSRV